MNTVERLVHMANQIALNFAAIGHDNAIAATADHIATFWDPRMRRLIAVHLAEGGAGLSDAARVAVTRLRDQGAPLSQTAATASGGSDAG